MNDSLADDTALQQLARRIGHSFLDLGLLRTALTHSTFVHEAKKSLESYERLEFLGDAVLGLVVSELLYAQFVLASEGELSRRRAQLVREESLALLAAPLALETHVRLGQGQQAAGVPARILADVFEAIVGALFVDGGLGAAREFVAPIVRPRLEDDSGHADAKTRLQEWCHRLGCERPNYELVEVRGPSHARTFVMQVRIAEEVLGRGVASSKKAAEQVCAAEALGALRHKAG